MTRIVTVLLKRHKVERLRVEAESNAPSIHIGIPLGGMPQAKAIRRTQEMCAIRSLAAVGT